MILLGFRKFSNYSLHFGLWFGFLPIASCGSISKDNVVISEASSSNSPTMVYVLEGTNITFNATCKNDTSKKGSNSLETTYESKNFELTYSISVSGWLSKKYTLSYSKTEY